MNPKEYNVEKGTTRASRIKDLVKQVRVLEKSNRTIQMNITKVFWASGFAATSSLVFLVFADYIHKFHLDIVVILIVLEAVIAATYFAWRLIKSLR